MYRSIRERGDGWDASEIPDGASVVEMDPSHPQTLYAAPHEGATVTVWVSRDGGERWAIP